MGVQNLRGLSHSFALWPRAEHHTETEGRQPSQHGFCLSSFDRSVFSPPKAVSRVAGSLQSLLQTAQQEVEVF